MKTAHPAAPVKPAKTEEAPPASFFEALKDFEKGRVVEMEKALNEPPPQKKP